MANLCRGDVILAIGGVATDAMTLSEGQNAILSSTQQLCFKIERSIHTVYRDLIIRIYNRDMIIRIYDRDLITRIYKRDLIIRIYNSDLA